MDKQNNSMRRTAIIVMLGISALVLIIIVGATQL